MTASTAPALGKVRIQDLRPGMKVARLDVDLNFVYVEVASVVPNKIDGRTRSYKVTLTNLGNSQDSCYRPFMVRPTQRLDVTADSMASDGHCPDDGRCHHECTTGCFRVACCGPLSGVFPGNRWPEQVKETYGETDGSL